MRRRKLGERLAEMEKEKINDKSIVVPVPDTAKACGDAYAYELGLPSKEGLVRNRYIGRTFIEGKNIRNDMVKEKFSVLTKVLKGKKVLLVDDSIVRGTTLKQIVRFLKEEGKAKEVHLRISCPPIVAPCFYGIDMSTVGELFAPRYMKNISKEISEEECAKMAKELGAESLVYMTKENLVKCIGLPKEDLCMACITGEYPTEYGKKLYEHAKKHKKFKGKAYSRVYE